jgi:hypothetical protein
LRAAFLIQPARRPASASDQTIPAIYAVRAIGSAHKQPPIGAAADDCVARREVADCTTELATLSGFGRSADGALV